MGVIYYAHIFLEMKLMDIFNHIGENRDEIIAVPFYGWIRNPVETMVRYAMSSGRYSYWAGRYEIFKQLPINDPFRLFNITMQYTIDSFFKAMMNCGKVNNIEKADIEKDFNELIMLSDPSHSSVTIMDVVLNRLLNEPFLKKIYIYAPVITDAMKNVIMKIFPTHNDIIFVIDATIREAIEYKEDTLTTIMVEDTDMFMDVLQSYSKEERKQYMGNKYFILPAKSSLTNTAKQMVQAMGILPEDPYRYKDFINANLGEVGSYADFLQLKMIKWRTNNDGNQ